MYRPEPWQVPTPDGVQRPVSVQANVSLPVDASADDAAGFMSIAQGIVGVNAAQLQHWMNSLRQQISMSGSDYTARQLNMPGMTAKYAYNMGQEKLLLDIYPSQSGEAGGQTSDTNLDGYICWIHAEPRYPDTINNIPDIPGPYNLFFNGYLIAQDYQPIGPVGGYPILFGRTALLCDSYVGNVEKLNPLINSSEFATPNPINPPNGWGQYKAGIAPDGTNQPTIPKTLGYWIFDWENESNPWQYVPIGGTNYEPWTQAMSSASGSKLPQFDKGLYFRSASKSPLLPRGMNNISATFSPQSKGSQEVLIDDIFIAEFYDRGKYRIASQSWTFPAQSGRGILMNDSPMLFGACNRSGGFSRGGGISFSLDPKVTSTFTPGSGTNFMLGPHDGMLNEATDYLAGLTPAQLAIYQAWEAEVVALAASYSASIASQLAALQSQIKAQAVNYNNAYKAAIVARFIAGNVMLYEDDFTDYNQYYAPNNISYSAPVPDDTTALVTQTTVTQIHLPGGGTYSQTSSVYGPMQEYYIDLTPSFSSFIINLANPLALAEQPEYIIVPGSEYSNTEGDVTVSGVQYEQDTTYAFLSNTNNYVGPAQPSKLLTELDTYITTNVTLYNSLLQQYQALTNSTPPNAPQMPDLGTSITTFEYSNISINGDQWSYIQ